MEHIEVTIDEDKPHLIILLDVYYNEIKNHFKLIDTYSLNIDEEYTYFTSVYLCLEYNDIDNLFEDKEPALKSNFIKSLEDLINGGGGHIRKNRDHLVSIYDSLFNVVDLNDYFLNDLNNIDLLHCIIRNKISYQKDLKLSKINKDSFFYLYTESINDDCLLEYKRRSKINKIKRII